MTPLVSVVIPAYNAQRTVAASIHSALAQTLDDLEVVVVDDGSSDDTAATAEQVDDPRVTVIRQVNAGAAAARNAGIALATGRYVALLDADDLWVEDKLARQIAVLEGPGDVRAVQSGAYFVNDELTVLSERRCVSSEDPLLDTLLFRNMPNNMSTLVIERDMFATMGAFDTSLVILEEWDMHIKVARHCNLVSIEDPLSLYRVHPGNRSRDVTIHIEPGLRVLERVFADASLPPGVKSQRRRIYAHFYTMLAGGSLRARDPRQLVRWGSKALATYPPMVMYLLTLPARRFSRALSRRRARTSRRHQ
jgi:glycosyltransferase involved in cell wall biosynthesis